MEKTFKRAVAVVALPCLAAGGIAIAVAAGSPAGAATAVTAAAQQDPSNSLTASVSGSSISLSWQMNSSCVYDVYRDDHDGTGFHLITSTGECVTSVVDRNVPVGTHTYKVQAVDDTGVVANFNQVTVANTVGPAPTPPTPTPTPTPAPPAPTPGVASGTLTAVASGSNVTLKWPVYESCVYDIYRDDHDGTGFHQIASTGDCVTSYTDPNVPNGTHTYKVEAVDEADHAGDGNGLPADFNLVTVTTQAPAPAVDLAKGRPASQSSTFSAAYAASKAVDGNTSGDAAKQSISATNTTAQPWWQVDLQAAHAIKQVTVFDRSGTNSQALQKYRVFVSSKPFNTKLTMAAQVAQPGVWASALQTAVPSPSTILTTPAGTTGRYVLIQLQGTNTLQLAEVVVQ